MGRRAGSPRAVLRLAHLLVGSLVAAYVYLPPGTVPGLRWVLMLIGVPAVTLTGLWLWQQAAIRRLIRRLGSRSASPRTAPVPTRGAGR